MKKFKDLSLIIILITIIIKLLGIFRQLCFSYFYGASNISDAINISQIIPITLFSIILTGLGASLIPMLNKIINQGDDINLYLSNIISITVLIGFIVIVSVELVPSFFIKLFASGFDGNTIKLAANFLKVTIFIVLFITINNILISFLKIKKKYLVSIIINFPLILLELISYFVANYINNPNIVIYFLVLGYLIQTIILLSISHKNGFRYRFCFDIKNKYLLNTLYLSMPIIIGCGLDEINVIVDKNIASSLQEGAISLLSYATLITNMVHTVIVVSLNTTFFPEVSECLTNSNNKKAIKLFYETTRKGLRFLIPITIGLLIFSYPISYLIYYRGNITISDIECISALIICYSIQIIPNGIRIFITSIYNALQKTKLVLIINIISIALNIIMDIIFSKIYSLNGIALATSISIIISFILSITLLKKHINEFSIKELIKIALPYLLLSVVVLLINFIIFKYFLMKVFTINISIFICILFSIIIYFATLLILKVRRVKK